MAFLSFLSEVILDAEDREYMHQLIRTRKAGKPIVIVLLGSGSNGKTTLLRAIRLLAGTANSVTIPEIGQNGENFAREYERVRAQEIPIFVEIHSAAQLAFLPIDTEVIPMRARFVGSQAEVNHDEHTYLCTPRMWQDLEALLTGPD
jgi:hypothetical protein